MIGLTLFLIIKYSLFDFFCCFYRPGYDSAVRLQVEFFDISISGVLFLE